MKIIVAIVLSFTLGAQASQVGQKWALLVAGSNSYFNYRHQADVCHAYQIMKANGIPDENIIVMMYDDIAFSERNPTPGIIINQPNGTNVYEGVPKDYTNNTLTPQNFLNILQGNSDAMKNIGSGRVINSGPEDTLFVYFSDHGSPGALMFVEAELTVTELVPVFNKMAKEKKFSKMVLYVEACFAGSMFDDILDDDLDIFVMTASDPHESSYACYFDDLRRAYLGDVFSVNWMHEAEKENLVKSSLNHLFEKVRTNTTTSHTEEYGDIDIGNTLLSDIIGSHRITENHIVFEDPTKDAVPSQDVPLHLLRKKLERAGKHAIKSIENELKFMIDKRNEAQRVVSKILLQIANRSPDKMLHLTNGKFKVTKSNMQCFDIIFEAFSNNCYKLAKNPYVAHLIGRVLNACNVNWSTTELILQAIKFSCNNSRKTVGVI